MADFPLFGNPDEWRDAAFIDKSQDLWKTYVKSYKIAAETLVLQMKGVNVLPDNIIIPTIFLYRHYIEIAIKHLDREIHILRNTEWVVPINHDLKRLWTILKENLIKFDYDQFHSLGIYWDCDNIIEQFSNIDPRSMVFRYPVNKEDKSLISGIEKINFSDLEKHMKHLAEVFDNTYYILHYLNGKAEEFSDQSKE